MVAAIAVLLGPSCAREPEPDAARPESVLLAAVQTAALTLESDPPALRFGTPPAEIHQGRGFERVRLGPRAETWVDMRRQADLQLSRAAAADRSAVLDLELPGRSPYRTLRVLLNGHRLTRLELGPGRRRYAFALPAARQGPGGNVLSFVFEGEAEPATSETDGGPRGAAARLFGLVIGVSSPKMDAIARAPVPFSAWPEGDDIVQGGPSRLGWAIIVPPDARLRFRTARRHGAPRFRVEVEGTAGERAPLWQGGPGRAANIVVPGRPGEMVRLWLVVETDDQMPAWGAWRGVRVTSAVPQPTPPPRPAELAAARAAFAAANVLVVVLDAAGALHFGCYGHPRRTTPNIDRIAAEGIVFDRAYTPAVFTRSAMASVWTSQLPDEHHASISYDEPLPANVPTLSAVVSGAGILTAGFVGNNMAGTAFGLDRGFSEFYRLSYRAEVLREYLFGWLSRNARRRFLAYVHYREPHYPYDPRPPFDTLFGPDAPLPRSAKTDSGWLERVNDGSHPSTPAEIDHLERLYDGNLAAVDDEIGRLRRHLEELGIWDRTVLVLAADHGEAMHEHGFIGHNEQVYEESVRVPLVLRFPPGTVPGGRRVGSLASLLDLSPTIADILGIPRGRTPTFRGRSLLSAAAGGPDTPPDGVLCRTVGSQPRYAWVGERYKYLYDTRGGEEELYDLGRDPAERSNLRELQPVAAAYFRQQLFGALSALPGRSGASPSGWTAPEDQREALRALGYVQ